MDVLGRNGGPTTGPTAAIGHYRARDGSHGTSVALDLDGPHAGLVVGKRGYGKSYTLGVLAEELTRATGIAPIVVDPMGVFTTLAEHADGTPVPATVVDAPTVDPAAIPPQLWCQLLDVDPASAVGAAIWRVASEQDTLSAMLDAVEQIAVDHATAQAAYNHLTLASQWGVFSPGGVSTETLFSDQVTVLNCSMYRKAPLNAVTLVIAQSLYETRIAETQMRLPWLLIDEVHTVFDGIAARGLRTILTRGRQPGVSFVGATQRPAALPDVATSQADLIFAHRLTAGADRDRLAAISPSYLGGNLTTRLPEAPGEVLLIDDVTERAHHICVRCRDTPHGGESPSASNHHM